MKKLVILSFFAGIVFSNELVEEIFRNLAGQPYGTVAPLIAKMQNEATHQPAPVQSEAPVHGAPTASEAPK
jgi:hypothetical protein